MYDSPSVSKEQDSWRKESDHRTLMDAAKILVDRVRLKGAMDHMKKCKAADKAMDKMIARFARTGKLA